MYFLRDHYSYPIPWPHMSERRYDDEEIAEILALATSDRDTSATARAGHGNGLTLDELRRSGYRSNGNLQAHVEPDGETWRLRMQTFKGDTAPMAGMGAMFSLMGMLIFLLALLDGSTAREMIVSTVFMLVGFGHLGYLRMSLPRWADERASQMEAVAERLRSRLASPATGPTQPGDESE